MSTGSLPNLLIVGVTKAGTTSLYWYLAQHPAICASTHKETNFFSPLRYGRPPNGALSDYAGYFTHCSGEAYRMEGSPEYFYGGPRLVEAVHEALPDVRIVVSLRDPMERLWSAYRYKRLQGGLDDAVSFRTFLDRCMALRRDGADALEENALYRALSIGQYIDSLNDWFKVFDEDVHVIFFEQLASSPVKTLSTLLKWLELDTGPAERFDYGVSQKTLEPRSKVLHHRAKALAATADRLFGLDSNRRLKSMLRDVYLNLNEKKRVERIDPGDRRRVEEFYAAANARLRQELSSRGYDNLPDWLRTDGQDRSGDRRRR